MRNFALGLSLSFAFILGALVAPVFVAPSSAQPGVARRQWEHHCVAERAGSRRGWASDVTELSQRLGAQGWEMVAIDGTAGTICFKRPR